MKIFSRKKYGIVMGIFFLSLMAAPAFFSSCVTEMGLDKPFLLCAQESENTANSLSEQEVLALARQHAPFLVFHPEEGKFCCYPSDAVEAYTLWVSKGSDIPENLQQMPKTLDQNAPCYFQYWEGKCQTPQGKKLLQRIKYWFWYRFNRVPNSGGIGNHLGDWEHAEVILLDKKPAVYILSCHELRRYIPPEFAQLSNDRIKVWPGKGTHANYESHKPAKPYKKVILEAFTWQDVLADGGEIWDTSKNLVAINKTPFANYRGHWWDPDSPVVRQFENKVGK